MKKTFADLGVSSDVVSALATAGITYPFPIQEMALPIALQGTDMIGQARTGTGKTLAFGIAVIERLLASTRGELPRALIMCPTRELALQVTGDLDLASAKTPVSMLSVYGGVGYDVQIKTLKRGVDVVIGTPGRLLDLVNRGDLDLSGIEILVLDEADEMLDLGFLPDVEKLISQCPTERQTLLFSATMPAQILALSRNHLNQPVNIRAEAASESTTVPNTKQFVYRAHDLDKPDLVAKVLLSEACQKTIIFTRTKRSADRLQRDLADRGFQVRSIHGDMSQIAREKALGKFREDKINVLVATDVAARGIDIAEVTHVINYECPDDENTYVHRIGRTGRAGQSGVAITLVDWADLSRWQVINKELALDFHDPAETYSTSKHLYEDHGIDPTVKPWLTDPSEAASQRESRTDRGARRGDGRNRNSRRDGAPRRRRMRNGQEVVEEKSNAEPQPRTRKPRTRRRLRNGVAVSEIAD